MLGYLGGKCAPSRVRAGSVALLILLMAGLLAGCSEARKPAPAPIVAAGEHDPVVWGARYPAVYQRWLATADERPAGRSAYKRGFDGGVMFDKLSEYPFMAVLFNGWGFGIDYNEPRGHHYMLIDQKEADPARVKAGGVCLTCKSSYAADLHEKDAGKLFSSKYLEAVEMLPEPHRELGAACIDCHDPATMKLATRRWTMDAAMAEIGMGDKTLTMTQQRLAVCGQCHCTYSLMKDGDKVTDVDFPWEGGEWGDITVEDIINNLETQPARLEWLQSTTGFKLGFIRHPDVEFFTAGSPHFGASLSCADCHMPDVETRTRIFADHNLMSPLKHDRLPCRSCHTQSDEEMRAKVVAIQDENLGRLIKAGYQVATVAKLFQAANGSLEATVGTSAYDEAAKLYRQAFYRVVYMGAENSVGFHNPPEAKRILDDASSYAEKADAAIRTLLASNGVNVAAEVDLDLPVYLNNRGVKPLGFKPEQLIADPSGQAPRRWPENMRSLR